MALTFTPSPEIGRPCPDFRLQSTEGQWVRLGDLNAPVLVIMFICNHCPYVKAVEDRILELARAYSPDKVQFVGICSNDPTDYVEDSLENLRKRAREKNYPFPYLHDVTQTVAKNFDAVCTPDFFVYDSNRQLAYRGRLDDNWKDPSKVKRRDLKASIDILISGGTPSPEQYPSMGCSIKWMGDTK